MADVKIRKLPDWVVNQYKRSAKLAGRSLEEELRVFLMDASQAKWRFWIDRLEKSREQVRKRHGALPNFVLEERKERERKAR
ncbi:MAG: FitA-like ribbon-helix-helix domain-containing protein [Rhizomicrobium sp.]